MKVLITPRGFANYGTDIVEAMEAKGLTVHYNNTGNAYTAEEFLELAKDADGIIVGVDIMDRAMMEQCPNLKVVCKFGVGTDNIDLEYAKERGIYVGRTIGSKFKDSRRACDRFDVCRIQKYLHYCQGCEAGRLEEANRKRN